MEQRQPANKAIILGQSEPMRDAQAADRSGTLADHRAFRAPRGAAREQHVVDILGLRDARRPVRRGSGGQIAVVGQLSVRSSATQCLR